MYLSIFIIYFYYLFIPQWIYISCKSFLDIFYIFTADPHCMYFFFHIFYILVYLWFISRQIFIVCNLIRGVPFFFFLVDLHSMYSSWFILIFDLFSVDLHNMQFISRCIFFIFFLHIFLACTFQSCVLFFHVQIFITWFRSDCLHLLLFSMKSSFIQWLTFLFIHGVCCFIFCLMHHLLLLFLTYFLFTMTTWCKLLFFVYFG